MGFLDGIFNIITQGSANAVNAKIARENMALQDKWNTINYRNQVAQQEYQKNLQQQIFQREDTAQQRAMNDLIAAGLSPTLAAGNGAGAGSVVNTITPMGSAPQNNFQANPIAVNLDLMGMAQGIQQIKATQQNLDYAREHNLPVGAMPARTLESWLIEALDPYAKDIGKKVASHIFGIDTGSSGAGESAGSRAYNPPDVASTADRNIRSLFPTLNKVGKVSPQEAQARNMLNEMLFGRNPYSSEAYNEFSSKDYGRTALRFGKKKGYWNNENRSFHFM